MVRDEILKQLEKNPDAEWPIAVLADKLGYSSPAGISGVLRDLVEDGSIVKVRRGVYRSSLEPVSTPPSSNGAKADEKLTFKLLKRKADQMLLLGSDGEVYAARPFTW